MSADVYEGKDGWLFLIGGTNHVRTLYHRNAPLLPDAKLGQWAELIEARAQGLKAMGIQYVHVNVPEKLTIYDDKFHNPPVVDWRLSPAKRLGEMLQQSSHVHVWLDLIESLRTARGEDELYFKTDTHWSAAGCFRAYKLLCERIRITPDQDLLRTRKCIHDGGYMDLGAKLEPPVPGVFKFYDFLQNSRRVYANSIAQYVQAMPQSAEMHVGSHVGFANETLSAANKKILIFGDSCSSHSSNALTGMLAESAREVEFIWSSNLDWAYIERMRPDVLVYELAERFITVVPRDNFNLRRANVWPGLRAQWLLYKTGNRAAPRAKLV